MKKFITLVLALALVLGLAAPAMAFTDDTTLDPKSSSPFDLDIYLVEYNEDVFGMSTTLPPSDRGYAKNEVVAAVVELVFPKDSDATDYSFEVTGEDVKLLDETLAAGTAPALDLNVAGDALAPAAMTAFENTSTTKTKTFKWLVFAKVTGDEASLTATLSDDANENDVEDDPVIFEASDTDYRVSYASGTYTVVPLDAAGSPDTTGDYDSIEIVVSTASATKWDGKSITIVEGSDDYKVGFYLNGNIFFDTGAGLLDKNSTGSDKTLFNTLVDIYEDVVLGDLGLDAKLSGKVKPSFFNGKQSAGSVEATVEIEPWRAYVTVPDEVIVTPPKTGDAASILGFVMVALSGAGAVALRKRG